jgi:hypothetical protein
MLDEELVCVRSKVLDRTTSGLYEEVNVSKPQYLSFDPENRALICTNVCSSHNIKRNRLTWRPLDLPHSTPHNTSTQQ